MGNSPMECKHRNLVDGYCIDCGASCLSDEDRQKLEALPKIKTKKPDYEPLKSNPNTPQELDNDKGNANE